MICFDGNKVPPQWGIKRKLGHLFQKSYWERKALEQRRPPDHLVVRHYASSKIAQIQKSVPIEKNTRSSGCGLWEWFFFRTFLRNLRNGRGGLLRQDARSKSHRK